MGKTSPVLIDSPFTLPGHEKHNVLHLKKQLGGTVFARATRLDCFAALGSPKPLLLFRMDILTHFHLQL